MLQLPPLGNRSSSRWPAIQTLARRRFSTALTGSRQHVGNYPGVTVERKEGRLRHAGHTINVVDLPGTYSLTAYSAEELVARSFLIEERPNVVVDIVDASNLERNLYLAIQFIELGVPLILALNMSDLAEARGCTINVDFALRVAGRADYSDGWSQRPGDQRTQGRHRQDGGGGNHSTDRLHFLRSEDRRGIDADRFAVGARVLFQVASRFITIATDVADVMANASSATASTRPGIRWLAVKLLENDDEVRLKVKQSAANPQPILAAVESASRNIEKEFGDAAEIAIANQRYGFISRVCREAVNTTGGTHRFLSDRIDSIVTHRILGLPIFLGLMFLVFKLTFTLGRPPMEWLESFFGWLGGTVGLLWPAGSESVLKSLIVDGIIGGVGGVLVFLPNILLLFLVISLLEDSGYMARAAFMIDRLMHKIGLHGKSFIPMLIGFGCTVPAIMGTRVLENRRDRLTTMLVLPLMSCGARLPIYTLFIPAFFPEVWQAPVLWLIYLIGIVLAVFLAKLLRSTVFQGEAAPFVMEMPPYRMPMLKGTLIHVGERGWQFLRKAGTIILGISDRPLGDDNVSRGYRSRSLTG